MGGKKGKRQRGNKQEDDIYIQRGPQTQQQQIYYRPKQVQNQSENTPSNLKEENKSQQPQLYRPKIQTQTLESQQDSRSFETHSQTQGVIVGRIERQVESRDDRERDNQDQRLKKPDDHNNWSNFPRPQRDIVQDRTVKNNSDREENQIKKDKYISRKFINDALDSSDTLKKNIQQYYRVPNSFRQAIDLTDKNLYPEICQDLHQLIEKILKLGSQTVYIVGEIYKSQKMIDFYEDEINYIKKLCVKNTRHKQFALQFIQTNIENFREYFILSPNNLAALPVMKFMNLIEFLYKKIFQNDFDFKKLFDDIQHLQKEIETLELREINENKKKIEQDERQKNSQYRNRNLIEVPEELDDYEMDYKNCPCGPHEDDFESTEQKFGTIVKLKIKEPYKSAEQYFNNNFYFLREDYMRSFRQAICFIRESTAFNVDIKQAQNNVFLYDDVSLQAVQITNNGMVWVLKMRPVQAKQKQIKWSTASRLMTGSLLLITTSEIPSDSMIFVTMSRREDKIKNCHNFQDYYNKTGYVKILVTILDEDCENSLQKFNKIMSKNDVIVLENKIFFETYVHYLRSLQKANVNELPFSENLVQASQKVPLPMYFSQEDQRVGVNYIINLNFNLHQKNVVTEGYRINIFDQEWPRYLIGSLDDSQYQAIKLMLKTGIALVQGPPGTGKTYCGALAVRTLLHNQDKWNKDLNQNYRRNYSRIQKQTQNCPILIVCYTNHALDQFLNHILTFESHDNIVRLGGRSKDENLMKCQVPFIKDNFKFPYREFKELQKQVEGELKDLLNAVQGVSFIDFQKYWPEMLINIVIDFCKLKDLQYDHSRFGNPTQQLLFKSWKSAEQPDQEIIDLIISKERDNYNQIKQGTGQIKAMRKILKNFQPPSLISVNELYQQMNLEESDDDQNLDSEEEEERKHFAQNFQDLDAIQLEKLNQKYYDKIGYDETKVKGVTQQLEKGTNLWDLSYTDRIRLCDHVFYQRYTDRIQNYKELYKQYQEMQEQLIQERLKLEIAYIKEKKIVGATVTGCAKYAHKLSRLGCKIMIIEEAAEVLESHVVSILSPSIQHLILIGDHQQLRPKVENYELESKYKTNISLFERLVKLNIPYCTLNNQRRMKSKFADFIRLIYEKGYNDHPQVKEERNPIEIRGVKDDLILFDHREREQQLQKQTSKQNSYEAEMIVNMIQYLIMNDYKPSQMTALTLYQKQALAIKKLIDPLDYQSKYGSRVLITTVDNYQGEENDIIFLSLVRSNNSYDIGFVKSDNRICVAFSRARIGLYVFGNFDCIEKSLTQQKNKLNSEGLMWLKFISLGREKKYLMKSIDLACEIHKKVTQIQRIQDWNQVRSGGCKEICNLRFDCGHVCKQQCHRMRHVRMNCREKCEITFSCGHQCTKFCRDYPCPPCSYMVEKQLPCGHKQSVQCHIDKNTVKCQSECGKQLSCGHSCRNKCFENCNSFNCFQEVGIKLKSCDHYIYAKCYMRYQIQESKCTKSCEETLKCGHKCYGTCDTCLNFTLHRPCKEPCSELLICQHKCTRRCGQPCLKCPKKCEYKCCEAICQKVCSDVCTPCLGKCYSECVHSICTKKCNDFCDRKPCDLICKKKLQCGCDCLGLCGETCPPICKNKEHKTYKENYEKFFGNESQEDALFYQLECQNKHIFEVKSLDLYFQKKFQVQAGIIQFFKCPMCDYNITKSSRYKIYIKEVFNNLNKLKIQQNQMILGSDTRKQYLLSLLVKNLGQINLQEDDKFYLNRLKQIIQKPEVELSLYHENVLENQINSYKYMIELRKIRKEYKDIQDKSIEQYMFIKQSDSLEKFYLSDADYIFLATDQFWTDLKKKINSLILHYQFVQLRTQLKKQQLNYNPQRNLIMVQLEKFLQELTLTFFMIPEEQIIAAQKFYNQNSIYNKIDLLETAKPLPDIKARAFFSKWFLKYQNNLFKVGMQIAQCSECVKDKNNKQTQDNQNKMWFRF